uniref:PCNA-associated factor histone-like domain-containing protein n=1 Tax=Strigops habroptila TaxID=2489341 RepID=A0A672UNJ7_STRHB
GRGGRTARSPLGHRSVTAPRAALSAGPSPTGRHAAGNPVCVRPVPPSQGGIGQFLQQPQENRVLGREAAGSSSQGPATHCLHTDQRDVMLCGYLPCFRRA